ncbi:hypothetical protein ACGFI9_14150 [Micromonospora sp. NPDC048930]|uniref:DUF7144 family membrane protein n=1 Tax=Micromonospora sp. NPDC048930 TaxID=3364261 RepID=UPI0037151DFD
MGSTARDGVGSAGPGRPLLAAGLLAGAGLVDVVTAWAQTFPNRFVVETGQGMYAVDITAWAWLHVAVGVAVTLAGLLVVTGRRGTVPLALGCAVLAITADLLLFPYAPIRAVLVVGLDGAAIRLLLRHRRAVRWFSAARRPGPSAPGRPPESPTTAG